MPNRVNIRNNVYALATISDDSAELTMYGDIYETRPINFWTDEPIEGNFILLDEFMQDLDRISGVKNLTIRLNSYGGDAGVSNTIHNRLRELARGGMNLTCIVDGVAMSGGSIIMCACDTVKVNPSSLIMIHNASLSLWGSYNANELLDIAERIDVWDKALVEVYVRKTGLSAEEISGMMNETTYMTGREAVDKGFADELIEDAEPLDIAASADGRSLYVRGRQYHLAPGMFAPDNIPTVTSGSAASDVADTPNMSAPDNAPAADAIEGGYIPMTLEELRAQYPELVSEIEAAAADAATAAERSRIQAIDQVASVFSDEMVTDAKYGEHPCTAQELSYRSAQAAAGQGWKFVHDMAADAEVSGVNDVTPVPAADEPKEPQTAEEKMAKARADVKALFAKEDK